MTASADRKILRSMPLVPALEVLRDARGDAIVVTTMGSTREWVKFAAHPLDFHYIPSAMGQGPPLALGLALAQPGREVIVVNGDGCLLMSLGSLVTITASGARNLTHVLIDNGVYEVTGGQRLPAAGRVDFVGMARAAGFPSAVRFDDLEAWRCGAHAALQQPGPRFIQLVVEPQVDVEPPVFRESMPQRIENLRRALGIVG
jgi:sulfopyruvate decarboxylase subunit beta